MKKVLLAVAILVASIYVWEAAASALLCGLSRQWDMFVFPFDQWWTLAPLWFGANWYSTLMVVISAALPGLGVGVAMVAVVLLAWRSKRPSLYGETGWAGQKEMRRGRIETKRMPF